MENYCASTGNMIFSRLTPATRHTQANLRPSGRTTPMPLTCPGFQSASWPRRKAPHGLLAGEAEGDLRKGGVEGTGKVLRLMHRGFRFGGSKEAI